MRLKKVWLILIFLLVIPTSVSASGLMSFLPFKETVVQNKADVTYKKVKPKACEVGFRFDFAISKCVEVLVPEHGVLDVTGHSYHCEFGFKKNLEQNSCEKVILPEHATISGSGDDFTCDRDYHRVANSNPLEQCEKVLVPSNGHIAAGGNDFDCNTGFSKQDGQCVDAKKPPYSKFFPNSDDWYCEAGFKKSEDGLSCEALVVPANARRSDTGTFWYCYQGFKLSADGRNCERVDYPMNAEPNWIGGWDCNQGFKKVNEKCEKVELPPNANWFSRGADFTCEPSYRKDEALGKCVRIELPDNAEYDNSSFGGWRCKQGFIKNLGGNRCDQFRLPEHAFWVGFNSWDCDAGFKKNFSGQSCDKVSIPEHAHASNSYDRWDCDAGYVKNYKENRCEILND